jgi:hypothetical protein
MAAILFFIDGKSTEMSWKAYLGSKDGRRPCKNSSFNQWPKFGQKEDASSCLEVSNDRKK